MLAGLRRLLVVSVALKPGQDNPQLIFESLNSTGMALTQADLVRNDLLMGHAEPEQTEWYETWWWPLKLGSVHREFREFRHWYPSPDDETQPDTSLQRLARSMRFGRHCCSFMFMFNHDGPVGA